MDIKTILADKGYDVEAVGPDVSIEEVAKILTEKKIGSVLVMDGDEILGIVNERSLVKGICIHGVDVVNQSVSEMMHTNVMVCSSDSSVDSIRNHMNKMNMRHLPVVDGGSRFQHWFETKGVRPLRPDR